MPEALVSVKHGQSGRLAPDSSSGHSAPDALVCMEYGLSNLWSIFFDGVVRVFFKFLLGLLNPMGCPFSHQLRGLIHLWM